MLESRLEVGETRSLMWLCKRKAIDLSFNIAAGSAPGSWEGFLGHAVPFSTHCISSLQSWIDDSQKCSVLSN